MREAERRGFASPEPRLPAPYRGRARHLAPRLRELWLHTNNSCNLACDHCLVSSGPGGDPGLDTDALFALIDEAASIGVERFYFTGGEPFYRRDAFDLVERVTRLHERDLTVLTNGILFQGGVLERLRAQDRARLSLQVSLDGATAATNDAVRGKGSFERILAGIRNLVDAGFAPTISTVVTRQNADQMKDMVRLVMDLGARNLHLLWIHKKRRWAELNGSFVPPATLHARLREAAEVAERLGVTIDNLESFRQRVNGAPGTRVDLGGAGLRASASTRTDGSTRARRSCSTSRSSWGAGGAGTWASCWRAPTRRSYAGAHRGREARVPHVPVQVPLWRGRRRALVLLRPRDDAAGRRRALRLPRPLL